LLSMLMVLVLHQCDALNLPLYPSNDRNNIMTTSRVTSASRTELNMIHEQFYDPYSWNEENNDEYNSRGQSRLARLAQTSQQHQHTSSRNINRDLQSTLDHELDMMEQKLLHFQESSSRRSQELINELELFSRQKRLWRHDSTKDAVTPATEGPFLGSLINDVDGECFVHIIELQLVCSTYHPLT